MLSSQVWLALLIEDSLLPKKVCPGQLSPLIVSINNNDSLFSDGGRPNASKLRMFSSVGCAVRTVEILTGRDFGAHGTPYYDTYFP